MLKKLSLEISKGDFEEAAKSLSEFVKSQPSNWREALLKSDFFPNPLQFSQEKFKNDFINIINIVKQPAFLNFTPIEIQKELEQLYSDVDMFFSWSIAINNRLAESDFLKAYTPIEQIQLMCCFFEDQARIGSNIMRKEFEKVMKATGEVDPVSQVFVSIKSETGTDVNITDAYEIAGEALETILKYLYRRYSELNPSFGTINPYGVASIKDINYLSNIHNAISMLWFLFRFRGWRSENNKSSIFLFPPSLQDYTKEEISLSRFNLYLVEHLTYAQSTGSLKIEKQIDFEANVLSNEWYKDIPVIQIRQAIDSLESFDIVLASSMREMYRLDIESLNFNDYSLNKIIIGVKYLRILANVYIEKCWSIVSDNSSDYSKLCPLISLKDMAKSFSDATNIDFETAKGILSLFVYDYKNKNLELWQQPFLPINKDIHLFIPSIISNLNLIKFFERHLTNSKYSFSERGHIFEKEVKNNLIHLGIQTETKSIKFIASDGKEIEYDLLAIFEGHIILAELKCLKSPSEIKERYNSWLEIQKGIEQVKRQKEILFSDWNVIRNLSSLALPEQAFDESKIIPIVITNIFTFTGTVVDGIPICDLTCFLRYFQSGEITVTGRDFKEKKVLKRIWKRNKPDPVEFKDYVQDPPQVSNYLTELQWQPVPPVDDNLIPLAFPIVRVVGSELRDKIKRKKNKVSKKEG